ncbi:uncharacterized protein LOC132564706 [Ylistrum balloti]|uniref:uncharacterized protein LOC132564706 n=1 Tax=Ylistrum balloti TaxID=509963 RepID=UPI002905B9E2|nr:uncharacterized protein LOC132564706 [Ylistrum balloti]
MLRAVVFENFVCFRDRQIIQFQDGPNFLVGANATGKSSIFDLVRRCLSNKANTSTSRVTDEKFPAFALCKYYIRERLSDELPEGSWLYSYLCVKHLPEDETQMDKLVCIPNTETCYLDCYTVPKDHFLDTRNVEYFDFCRKTVEISTKLEELEKNHSSLDSFHEMIQELKQTDSYHSLTSDKLKLNCEDILQKIHDVVVLTFSIRSPGPIQWSHTQNIGIGNEHYETASKKAEILQKLLESDDVDQDFSKKVFDTIVQPLEYTFKMNPDSTITVNDGSRDIQFLKIPEGVIEARQFSLMFAHKKFQTIMFEEPDRGMHPSMIQKLRDLVIRKSGSQKKVLVFVSHQPAMINRWGMSRMYICRRKQDAKRNWKHSVFKLSEKVENIHQFEDKLKEMLYATGVLFVEGNTDKSVIGSVFDHILEAEHPGGVNDLNGLQKLIARIQVISTDGTTTYNTLKHLAENLGIPFVFLFDKDAMFKCMANVRPQHNKDWRKLTLFFVKTLLQRRKKYKHKGERGEDENEEMRKRIQTVLDTLTINTKSVRKALKFKDTDLEQPSFTTIASFIQDVVLPSELIDTHHELNKQKAKAFDLPVSKYSCTTKDILDWLKINKQIYLWDSGNIEDVICTSILKSKENEEKKENLLRSIFLGGKYTDEGKYSKDPIKETLKQMDSETSESIATCLLNSKEMNSFLEFLLEFGKERL